MPTGGAFFWLVEAQLSSQFSSVCLVLPLVKPKCFATDIALMSCMSTRLISYLKNVQEKYSILDGLGLGLYQFRILQAIGSSTPFKESWRPKYAEKKHRTGIMYYSY
jgi:hypothetical protein